MFGGRGRRAICTGVFEGGDQPGLGRRAWDPGGGLRAGEEKGIPGGQE